jgi:hypothetical protein
MKMELPKVNIIQNIPLLSSSILKIYEIIIAIPYIIMILKKATIIPFKELKRLSLLNLIGIFTIIIKGSVIFRISLEKSFPVC